MTQWKLRELGTTGPFAPNLKRAAGILSNKINDVGSMDTNLATANGDDKTGVGKFYVHAYNRATDNGVWTQSIAYTLVQPAVSATKQFLGAFAVAPSNSLYMAYVGTDNSVRLVTWTGYDGNKAWGAPTEQIILAANAVTNRIRAIDLALSTTGSITIPAVAIYEATASTGKGSFCRVYARRSDGTTWDKAFERALVASTLTIKAGGEDVSISFEAGTIAANVAKLAVYMTMTATTADSGDRLDNLTWNVSTGGTATTVGTWFANLNKSMASGQRRGWLYSDVAGRWVFATSVGLSAPFFEGIKLRHNVFTGIVRNRIGNSYTNIGRPRPLGGGYWTQNKLSIFADANLWGCISTTYADNRLLFAFNGLGVSGTRAARSLVMAWPNATTDTASAVDTSARMFDNDYAGPPTNVFGVKPNIIGIYGGNNANIASGFNDYNFVVMYGDYSNTVSATEDTRERHLTVVAEDSFTAPQILNPKGFTTIPTGRPLLQMSFRPNQAYLNIRGRPVWQVSTSSDFTTDLRTYRNSASPYISFDGVSTRAFAYQMSGSDLRLQSGTWYIRGYIEDDFGLAGAYSVGGEDADSFKVSHPPVALPLSPSGGRTLLYSTTGDMNFSWRFTDAEVGDAQSAYQVIIERLDTGVTVTDTGKVVSTSKMATINLASSLKDTPLQWRVRLWDQDNVAGVYSDPQLFTVADPPTVTITSPTQGQVVTSALPTFTWTFAAGGTRTQRAYRITVYDGTTSTPTPVAESGWFFGTDTSYTFPSKILDNNKTYSLVIQVQDDAGLFSTVNREVDFGQKVSNSSFEADASNWTGASGATAARSTAQAHRGSASLLVTAGAAASPHADSNSWPVTPGNTVRVWGWMYAPVGTALQGIRVNFFDSSGVYMSTLGTGVTLTPGTWTFRDTSVTVPVGAATATANAGTSDTPGTGYQMHFDEIQANGTGPEIVTFDSDWIEPVPVVPTLTADQFKVIVSWTDALKDSDFVSWRVYRRYMKPYQSEFDLDNTAITWELVYETSDQASALSFWDYTTPFGKPIDYVVVQLVDRFGALIESDITAWGTITQKGDRYYFIPEIPVGSIASFEAGSVNGDSFNAEVEQETIHVIGRGRQVQVGDDLGYSGSLTIRLRNAATARRDREFLELLASPKTGNVYLKSPFGDVLYVRLGPISTTRQSGYGSADIADISIPYLVVFQENPPITRVG